MTLWVTVGCDVCGKKLKGLDWDTDPEALLAERGWDTDPEMGHRCAACMAEPISALSSDDLLELETTVKSETVDCKKCGRPVFFGRPSIRRGYHKSDQIAFNADPHHCGFAVKTAVISRLGTDIVMEPQYYRVGVEHPQGKPLYASHQCRKSDIEANR